MPICQYKIHATLQFHLHCTCMYIYDYLLNVAPPLSLNLLIDQLSHIPTKIIFDCMCV